MEETLWDGNLLILISALEHFKVPKVELKLCSGWNHKMFDDEWYYAEVLEQYI